jgi:hypothetical protein
MTLAENHALRDSGIERHWKTVDDVDPTIREEFERKVLCNQMRLPRPVPGVCVEPRLYVVGAETRIGYDVEHNPSIVLSKVGQDLSLRVL